MASWNRTKIIATLGPASAKRGELAAMMRAGASVFRINGAHGTAKEHRDSIALVRSISRSLDLPAAVLFDLPGPKYRIGRLMKEPLLLKRGDTVTLACGTAVQTGPAVPVPHHLHRTLKRGNDIFINDGIVGLRVQGVSGKNVACKVIAPGEIRSFKGLNLPRVKLPAPALTAADRRLLDFALRHGVDYVGLSFVRSSADIRLLRRLIEGRAPHTGIVAKIEKPEALDDLDAIIAESDAIMVARGDLGIEMPFDQLPLIQMKILARCMRAGKPSICATQMLESMVNSRRPTRAEATDVAGAVWEGADAVMLSEETSIGKNPAAAVDAMARIALGAERERPVHLAPEIHGKGAALQAEVICRAAGFIAESLGARAIVTPTRSGRTPLFVSRGRPCVHIVAPTEDERVARRMCLYWGVRPVTMRRTASVDEMLRHAQNAAMKSGLLRRGDTIVTASGAHGHKGDITRLIEVRRV